MLLNIGITDTNLQLILNIVYSVIGWIFSATGSRLHDKIGRRKMLIGATVGMVVCLAIVAGAAAGFVEYDNQAAPTVCIVFIFMFGAIFAAGYTPMQPIYPAEVVSTKMRAKAMGMYKITNGAAGFLNTFVGPIALSNVSRVILFFSSCSWSFLLLTHVRSDTGFTCSLSAGTHSRPYSCTSSS